MQVLHSAIPRLGDTSGVVPAALFPDKKTVNKVQKNDCTNHKLQSYLTENAVTPGLKRGVRDIISACIVDVASRGAVCAKPVGCGPLAAKRHVIN